MLRKFFLNRKSKPQNFYILAAITTPVAIATAVSAWTVLAGVGGNPIATLYIGIMPIGPIGWSVFIIGAARMLSRLEKKKIRRVPQRTPPRRGMVIFLNIFFLLAFVSSLVILATRAVSDIPLYVVLFNVWFIIVTGGHFFFAPLDDYFSSIRSLRRRT